MIFFAALAKFRKNRQSGGRRAKNIPGPIPLNFAA
jgi:hypothetical protein